MLETTSIEEYIRKSRELDAEIYISFNGGQWERYRDKLFSLIEQKELSDKMADGMILKNDKWHIHDCTEAEIVVENGVDTMALRSAENGSIICFNGGDYVKTSDGINILVYDKKIKSVVDYVGFTGADCQDCVR